MQEPSAGQSKELLDEAIRARSNAYAPYSHFKVGAAVHLREQDAIVGGCNVENVSYGATICAERNAILASVARYGSIHIDEIVVVSDDEPPAVPCALCLQVLQEFCEPTLKIHVANLDGIQKTVLLSDLLPQPFTSFHQDQD